MVVIGTRTQSTGTLILGINYKQTILLTGPSKQKETTNIYLKVDDEWGNPILIHIFRRYK